jgi:phage terminase large subunit
MRQWMLLLVGGRGASTHTYASSEKMIFKIIKYTKIDPACFEKRRLCGVTLYIIFEREWK